MTSLFEIDQAILACCDAETGEIIDPEQLDALLMERNEKIESVALWIKNLKSNVVAYDAEIAAFEERKEKDKKRIESLQNWLINALGGQKFTTTKCAVSFRRSETVEVSDVEQLPAEFLRVKTTIEPNKTAIKEMLKSGREIIGCTLIEKQNMSIK